MKQSFFLISLILILIHSALAQAGRSPNILLIVTDDMDGTAPGIFGGVFSDDVTPQIDALAREGMRFAKAHVTVAVCQPSRQIMMTGKYPLNIGAMGFTPIDEDVVTLGQLLSREGYLNGIYNKEGHLRPRDSYEWDYIKNGNNASKGRSRVRTRQMTEEFIDMADAEGAPFFLMANTTDPHAPFYGSQDELDDTPNAYTSLASGGMEFSHPTRIFTEDEITLPGFLKDTGTILEDVTQYVNSCRRADDIVGEILDVLEEKGKKENTIVVFLSDNGMPFSSAKFETYFQSTRTPLIVSWPGHIAANTLNDTHYVSGIDIMPTLLDAAGIDIPSDLDGSSFLPLLTGENTEIGNRNKVVTAHFETVAYVSEGTSIRTRFLERGYVEYDSRQLTRPRNLRCVQSNDYGYIFNASDTGFNRTGPSMTLEAMVSLNDEAWWNYRQDFLDRRGPEEFYNFGIDPNGLNNLIDDPDYAELINQYRETLRRWMAAANDPCRFEYQHLLDGTTPSTYLEFANLSDGQLVPSGNKVLSNVKLEYVMLDYVKAMTLLVNGEAHQELIRAPFDLDISDLGKGDYTLRLQLRSNSGEITYSDEIHITIGDEAPPIDWTADPDRDGRNNLLEFAQGTDMDNPDKPIRAALTFSGKQLKITIQERDDLEGVSREVHTSEHLSGDSWVPVTPATEDVLENNGTVKTLELQMPAPIDDRMFYRIRYSK